MLGAIIGDIVGSRFEFNNTDNYNFELFTEESTFTDDTICTCLLYTSPSPRDRQKSRMPSSA